MNVNSFIMECENKYDELMLEQFYKKDENPILFNLYKVICNKSSKELTYTEICKKYNSEFASSRKRTATG